MVKHAIGKEGLELTWQAKHEEFMDCPKCNGKARIAIAIKEDFDKSKSVEEQEKFICDLRQKSDKIWPHDCAAFAIYICTNCGEGIVYWNQA